MQKLTLSAIPLLFLACSSAQGESGESTKDGNAVIDHVVQSLSGKDVDLSQYRGKAMLIVNTASKCGFTPQYTGLQETSADIRGEVKWNFGQFLVDRDGQVIRRFDSRVKPMSSEFTEAVEAVLPG